MSKYDVITFGSALLDIYIRSNSFKKVDCTGFESGIGLCQEYGGKMEMEELEVTTGGAGTNNAVSFARKGFRTAIVCEMGKDVIGQMIKLELAREGVDISLVVEEGREETGLASIMVAGDGGKSAAIYRGASRMLTLEDMKWDQLDASWFYISSLGGHVELVEALVNHATERGMRVAFNPGGGEIERMKADKQLSERVLNKLELLILNREEAEELTGIDFKNEEVWQGGNCIVGPRITVVTAGQVGGKVCEKDKVWLYEKLESKTVEETGAGDAFGSGLVAALMSGKSMEEAIGWGKKQAASVVSFMGPKKGLMTIEQIVM